MKSKLPLIILVSAFALVAGAGCGPTPLAGKVDDLEARLNTVQTQCDQMHQELTNSVARHRDISLALSTLLEAYTKANNGRLDELEEKLSRLTNTPARVVYANQRPAALATVQGTRDGVPSAVYNQLAADAAKEWPGNYEMQKYTLDIQIKAYRALHP